MKRNIILFVIAATFLAGCGQDKPQTNNTGDTTKTTQGQNTTPPANTPPQATDTAGTKGNLKDNELGMVSGLPGDFPKDVPQPRNGKCLGMVQSAAEGKIVTFESTESVQESIKFYQEEMKKNGFEPSGEQMVSDKGGMLVYKKGNMEVGVTIGGGDVTQVVINYKQI